MWIYCEHTCKSSHQYVKRPQIRLLLDPKHHLLMHGVKEKKRWPIFICDSLSLVYRWIPYPNKSKSGNMIIMTNHETWKASSAEWLDLSETQGLAAVSNLIFWKVLTCHVFFGCWDFWKLFEFALPFFISSSHWLFECQCHFELKNLMVSSSFPVHTTFWIWFPICCQCWP